MNRITEVLIQRLEDKGLPATEMLGLIRSVMIVIADNPFFQSQVWAGVWARVSSSI